MKKRIFWGVLLAFCFILPIHAMENIEPVEAAEGTVSGNSVSENNYHFEEVSVTAESGYEVYRYQLQAQLCEKEMEYLSVLQEAGREKANIATVKYELGYITEIEAKEAEMNVEAIELQMATAKERLQFYSECIQLLGGECKEDMLGGELPALSKDYIPVFLEQSSQLSFYHQQIVMYEQALNTNDLEEKDKQAVGSRLAGLRADKQAYEINLKKYVMNLELQYNTILNEIQQYDNEITLMQLKVQNQKLLFEKGKTAKSTLTEKETELQRLRYERLSKVCNGQLIFYLLEHVIENQTV